LVIGLGFSIGSGRSSVAVDICEDTEFCAWVC